MCTNNVCCQVLIDTWTVDQHSIPRLTLNRNIIDTSVDNRSVLDQHLIDISVDNRSVLDQHLIDISVECQLLFKHCIVGLHSATYQLTVD